MSRTLKYLKATAKLPLTLETSSIQTIKWYVDASFAVHPDMRSHTGALMTMGKGCIRSLSLFHPGAIRKRGYPEASARIALISNPGEDPVPPATASGRHVARESLVHVSMRKRRCITVNWPFLRKRTMGPIRLLSRWWIMPLSCLPSAVCVPLLVHSQAHNPPHPDAAISWGPGGSCRFLKRTPFVVCFPAFPVYLLTSRP